MAISQAHRGPLRCAIDAVSPWAADSIHRLGMPALSRSAVAPTGHMSKSRNFPTRTRQTPTSRGTALDRTTIVAAAFSEHMVKCWRVTANPHNGIRPVPGRFL
jgi:hypothetical protein